jgi:hypothetical protein
LPSFARSSVSLKAETDNAVKSVTGEELEVMMQEWDQPLVLDAYATVSIKFCRFSAHLQTTNVLFDYHGCTVVWPLRPHGPRI